MRHALARCRYGEIKKAHLPFPTLHLFAARLHWSSRIVLLYGSFYRDSKRTLDRYGRFRPRTQKLPLCLAG